MLFITQESRTFRSTHSHFLQGTAALLECSQMWVGAKENKRFSVCVTTRCVAFLCFLISVSSHLMANCPPVDSNGCSRHNSEACVANAGVTRRRSAHSWTACQTHDGLFSPHGSQDTVHANGVRFIFLVSLCGSVLKWPLKLCCLMTLGFDEVKAKKKKE